MERKEKKSFFDHVSDMDPKLFIGLLAVSGVVFGAILGSLLLSSQERGPKIPPTPTVKDPFAVSTAQLILPTREVTLAADSTVPTTAVEINEFLAQTQTAAAIVPTTAEPISADTEVSAEEGQNPTPAVITATPNTGLPGTLEQLAAQPVLLSDAFDDDANGWTPFASTGFAVSMDSGMMQIFFSEPSFNPFLWTCDACGTFERYSYQVDVKLPTNGTAIAGIVFGSPSRIDELPFQEAYALSIYNSGEMVLQHISASGIQVVEKWDKYHSQFTPDENFHTLQVLANGNKAAIYIDGKSLGDEIELTNSSSGYVGLVVQSTNQLVYFDNMQVIALP